MSKVFWISSGEISGDCGHHHPHQAAAMNCQFKYERRITTKSDRRVVKVTQS